MGQTTAREVCSIIVSVKVMIVIIMYFYNAAFWVYVTELSAIGYNFSFYCILLFCIYKMHIS